MIIRTYQATDLTAAAELFTAAVHGLAADAYDERQRDAWAPRSPDLEHWQKRFDAMRVLLADEDGSLTGMLGYHDSGHIDLLFTHPDHARKGVAQRLHDEAERRLERIGVRELFTEASEVARPFFERQGYAVERREVVQARGVDLHRYVMRRRV